ncbi:MAG: hypothetical protein IPK85_23155 [Gemmatimonadetes bacterium]|nr:hypothetical protein [Gemmatimonadota bacterium]
MKWQRLWLSGLMLCCGNVGAQDIGVLVGTERWYPGDVATARRVEASHRGISLRLSLPR